MFIGCAIFIHPHGCRATDGHWHHDKVHYGDHRKQGHGGAETETRSLGLLEGKFHVGEGHLMVIEGIITVLYRHHPGTKQEPDDGSKGLTDKGDPEQDQADDGPGQVIFKLYPFPAQYPWQILDEVYRGAGIEIFTCEVLLDLFGE